MKKNHVVLLSLVFALCSNLFAVTVGETMSYSRNADRTSKIIRGATGKLKIVQAPSNMVCDGVVVQMDYELDVLIKGKQKGDMGVCVPQMLFDNLTKEGSMSYGAFDLTNKGLATGKDASGKSYTDCTVVHADKVDQNYVPVSNDKAKVMWINHNGSIKFVTNLEITFKSHSSVPVLGAVEVDVSGVSNNGIAFKVGLDAMMQ